MMPTRDRPARDLLDFYTEAGVDALVGEEPVDRFAAVEAPAPPARRRNRTHRRRDTRSQGPRGGVGAARP